MSKRVTAAAAALVLLVAGGAGLAWASAGPDPAPRAEAPPDGVVATVDGHPVTEAELAAVAETASLDPGGRAALDAVVRFKVMQLAAHERGLVDAVDHDDVLAGLAATNAAQEAAIGRGEVVHGVSRFTEDTYLGHVASTLRHDLLNELLRIGELGAPDDAELRAYYERTKDQYARRFDDVELRVLRFEPSADGLAQAEAVAARLRGGASFDTVWAGYEARPPAALVGLTPLDVGDDDASSLAKYQPSLYEAAAELASGETRQVVDDLGGGVLVVHCAGREPAGYRDLEEVREELVLHHTEEQFERFVDGLVAGAGVLVDR